MTVKEFYEFCRSKNAEDFDIRFVCDDDWYSLFGICDENIKFDIENKNVDIVSGFY